MTSVHEIARARPSSTDSAALETESKAADRFIGMSGCSRASTMASWITRARLPRLGSRAISASMGWTLARSLESLSSSSTLR
jgi:hypothetical protein